MTCDWFWWVVTGFGVGVWCRTYVWNIFDFFVDIFSERSIINNVPNRYKKILWQGNEEVSQTVVKAIKQTQCSLMKPTKVSDKHT